MFSLERDGRPATRADLLLDWTPFDRLGVIVTEPFGSLGASHLIQLAITAFYDVRPQRRRGRVNVEDARAMYPEIYLFHVGGRFGDHSMFDFWPARKEVFVEPDPRFVLAAINDRGITRLAVPDTDPVDVRHEYTEPAAARDRIRTALAYSASGRVRSPNWTLTGLDQRTEANPTMVLAPDKRLDLAASAAAPAGDPVLARRSWSSTTPARIEEGAGALHAASQRREALRNAEGLASETYREISVDQAVHMLV